MPGLYFISSPSKIISLSSISPYLFAKTAGISVILAGIINGFSDLLP
jgi:hypothetical protein